MHKKITCDIVTNMPFQELNLLPKFLSSFLTIGLLILLVKNITTASKNVECGAATKTLALSRLARLPFTIIPIPQSINIDKAI